MHFYFYLTNKVSTMYFVIVKGSGHDYTKQHYHTHKSKFSFVLHANDTLSQGIVMYANDKIRHHATLKVSCQPGD